MSDLPAFPSGDEFDDLVDSVEPAYSVEWDADRPGGGGAAHVYPWKGGYVVVSEMGDDVVYPTLEAAITGGEVNYVTGATVSIDSTELTTEALAGMLRTFDGEDYRIEINGEPYESVEVTDFPGDAPRAFQPVTA
ncbi:hypothetical protein [Rubrivirga sp.]|uniref:hypothetical protein n=1 Tax=Rubrivirga sp. TaxID=1885344 RepID=UPI003C72CF93